MPHRLKLLEFHEPKAEVFKHHLNNCSKKGILVGLVFYLEYTGHKKKIQYNNDEWLLPKNLFSLAIYLSFLCYALEYEDLYHHILFIVLNTMSVIHSILQIFLMRNETNPQSKN